MTCCKYGLYSSLEKVVVLKSVLSFSLLLFAHRFVHQLLPAIAQTPSTRIRWWQPTHSGANNDQWALDQVYIGSHNNAHTLQLNFQVILWFLFLHSFSFLCVFLLVPHSHTVHFLKSKNWICYQELSAIKLIYFSLNPVSLFTIYKSSLFFFLMDSLLFVYSLQLTSFYNCYECHNIIFLLTCWNIC